MRSCSTFNRKQRSSSACCFFSSRFGSGAARTAVLAGASIWRSVTPSGEIVKWWRERRLHPFCGAAFCDARRSSVASGRVFVNCHLKHPKNFEDQRMIQPGRPARASRPAVGSGQSGGRRPYAASSPPVCLASPLSLRRAPPRRWEAGVSDHVWSIEEIVGLMS